MIRLEGGSPGKLRVIGSLERAAVDLLFEALSRGPVILDLSEVTMADEEAVRVLADLPSERCAIVSGPKWLVLWLDRLRRVRCSDAH